MFLQVWARLKFFATFRGIWSFTEPVFLNFRLNSALSKVPVHMCVREKETNKPNIWAKVLDINSKIEYLAELRLEAVQKIGCHFYNKKHISLYDAVSKRF